MRFVIGPLFIAMGAYVAIRPIGYATQLARWIRWVAPSNRLLPADGDPSKYARFARAVGVFFVFGGAMVLLHGF